MSYAISSSFQSFVCRPNSSLDEINSEENQINSESQQNEQSADHPNSSAPDSNSSNLNFERSTEQNERRTNQNRPPNPITENDDAVERWLKKLESLMMGEDNNEIDQDECEEEDVGKFDEFQKDENSNMRGLAEVDKGGVGTEQEKEEEKEKKEDRYNDE